MQLLSVVIPVRDERANLRPLVQWLRDSLSKIGPWEAVFVDDGSTDGTHLELLELADTDDRIKCVRLRRNYGQSAAMQAGFDHAEGDVIATMDGDLQNDPADLPRMIAALDLGYDCILGERANRRDTFLLRKLPSICANWLIRRVLGVQFRDFGCTLRVMRRDVADGFSLYGERHRFITAFAVQGGARILQIPVRHHPRTAGVSKYNVTRTVRVVLDLLAVKLMHRFHSRPMHLFGGVALLMMLAGFACFGIAATTEHSPWLFGAILELMGVQFFGLGLLGEAITRDHFGRRGNRPYTVRETANMNPSEEFMGFNEFKAAKRKARTTRRVG